MPAIPSAISCKIELEALKLIAFLQLGTVPRVSLRPGVKGGGRGLTEELAGGEEIEALEEVHSQRFDHVDYQLTPQIPLPWLAWLALGLFPFFSILIFLLVILSIPSKAGVPMDEKVHASFGTLVVLALPAKDFPILGMSLLLKGSKISGKEKASG